MKASSMKISESVPSKNLKVPLAALDLPVASLQEEAMPESTADSLCGARKRCIRCSVGRCCALAARWAEAGLSLLGAQKLSALPSREKHRQPRLCTPADCTTLSFALIFYLDLDEEEDISILDDGVNWTRW